MTSQTDQVTSQTTIINNRKWIENNDVSGAGSLRLLTYNILTDKCIRPGDYLYCPEQNRYMTSRHVAIMSEVVAMDADIICFQEVDSVHYRTRLQPSMTQLGYQGILLHRPDDQGLATFWKSSNFTLEQQKHALLHHLAETSIQMCSVKSHSELCLLRSAIERPEAVLLVRLRHINTNRQLAVANIHVTWSQLKYPALQALQMCLAVNELSEFVRNVADCSQIICGDFNSPPDSVPYQIMSRGQLDDVMLTSLRNSCTVNNEDQVEVLRSVGLFDVLPRSVFTVQRRLLSAYKTLLDCEPEVTNCDDSGMLQPGRHVHQLCLDYIWFSCQSLEVAGVLQTPPSESITKHYALPSVDFPSDHIPLLAQFYFI